MLTASGCAATPRPTAETVLPPNSTLEAHTPGGSVRVTAVSPDTRRYVWADRDVTVTLAARQHRFAGTLGLYEADADLPGSSTITRGVLLESQIHFTNLAEAEHFLSLAKDPVYKLVWTRTGLAVASGQIPEREQFNATIYQVCIAGRTPANLPGAHDGMIALLDNAGRPVATPPCANPGRVDNYYPD
jgi:hypothetical protein